MITTASLTELSSKVIAIRTENPGYTHEQLAQKTFDSLNSAEKELLAKNAWSLMFKAAERQEAKEKFDSAILVPIEKIPVFSGVNGKVTSKKFKPMSAEKAQKKANQNWESDMIFAQKAATNARIGDVSEQVGEHLNYLDPNLADTLLNVDGTTKRLGEMTLTELSARQDMWLTNTVGNILSAGKERAVYQKLKDTNFQTLDAYVAGTK